MRIASGRTTETRSVSIIGDHAAFRQALACVLEWRANSGHTSQAGSLTEARDRASDTMDVVIVDLCLRNGDELDLIRDLRDTYPGAMVLALTLSRDPEHYARAVRAGASVVVTKEATLDEILRLTRDLSARTAAQSDMQLPGPNGTLVP